MYGFTNLAVLALATSSMAVHVEFRRFAQPGCPEPHHIQKDTDLHDNACKTFDPKEPMFESFAVAARKGDWQKQVCKATVFDQANCKGNHWDLEDIKDNGGKCADNFNNGVVGASVWIECGEKPISLVHVLSNIVATATSVSTVTASPTPSSSSTIEWVTSVQEVVMKKPKAKVVTISDYPTETSIVPPQTTVTMKPAVPSTCACY